jgi:hypothetical protein
LFKNIVLPAIENIKNPSAQALIFLLFRGKIKVNTKNLDFSKHRKNKYYKHQELDFCHSKIKL